MRRIVIAIIALVVCLLVVLLLLLRLVVLRGIHGHLIVIAASKRHLVNIRLLLLIWVRWPFSLPLIVGRLLASELLLLVETRVAIIVAIFKVILAKSLLIWDMLLLLPMLLLLNKCRLFLNRRLWLMLRQLILSTPEIYWATRSWTICLRRLILAIGGIFLSEIFINTWCYDFRSIIIFRVEAFHFCILTFSNSLTLALLCLNCLVCRGRCRLGSLLQKFLAQLSILFAN